MGAIVRKRTLRETSHQSLEIQTPILYVDSKGVPWSSVSALPSLSEVSSLQSALGILPRVLTASGLGASKTPTSQALSSVGNQLSDGLGDLGAGVQLSLTLGTSHSPEGVGEWGWRRMV